MTISPYSLTLNVQGSEAVALGVAENDALVIGMTQAVVVNRINGDPWEGAYSVTPAAEAQVLATKNKTMEEDFTVEAIPSNYGLITWNGSVLTVS